MKAAQREGDDHLLCVCSGGSLFRRRRRAILTSRCLCASVVLPKTSGISQESTEARPSLVSQSFWPGSMRLMTCAGTKQPEVDAVRDSVVVHLAQKGERPSRSRSRGFSSRGFARQRLHGAHRRPPTIKMRRRRWGSPSLAQSISIASAVRPASCNSLSTLRIKTRLPANTVLERSQ